LEDSPGRYTLLLLGGTYPFSNLMQNFEVTLPDDFIDFSSAFGEAQIALFAQLVMGVILKSDSVQEHIEAIMELPDTAQDDFKEIIQ